MYFGIIRPVLLLNNAVKVNKIHSIGEKLKAVQHKQREQNSAPWLHKGHLTYPGTHPTHPTWKHAAKLLRVLAHKGISDVLSSSQSVPPLQISLEKITLCIGYAMFQFNGTFVPKTLTLTTCKLLCWHIPHSAGNSVHLSNWDWQNKRKENIKKQTFNLVWATKHKLLTEVTVQRMLKSSLHTQRQGVKSPEQKHSTASVSNCKEAQSSCRKALASLTTWNTVLPLRCTQSSLLVSSVGTLNSWSQILWPPALGRLNPRPNVLLSKHISLKSVTFHSK